MSDACPTRICGGCGETKPAIDFGNGVNKSYCKLCKAAVNRDQSNKRRRARGLPDITTPLCQKGRKHWCDFRFFQTIDSEAKAYWLGFIAADGSVSHSYSVKVGLKGDDYNHLVKLKTALNATNHVYLNTYSKRARKIGHKTTEQKAHFSIFSKEMQKDLAVLGVMPKKTFNLEFPTSNQVPDHLLHHYVRGYFDGDGTIHRRKGNGWGAGFVGRAEFIAALYRKIQPLVEGHVHCHAAKNPAIVALRVVSYPAVERLREYLYRDATIWLDRKKARFDEFQLDYRASSPYTNVAILQVLREHGRPITGAEVVVQLKGKYSSNVVHRYLRQLTAAGWIQNLDGPIKRGKVQRFVLSEAQIESKVA